MRDQAPHSLDTREQRPSSFSPPDFLVSSCDECLMSTAKMSQFLRDPKGAAAPFNMSLGRPTRAWSWFEEPGNTWRGRRFNAAMAGGGARFPSWIFTDGKCTRPILLARYLHMWGSGLDWKSIKNGGVVVDVGGGIGSTTLILAKAFPHLRYVVQDLDNVIIEAHKVSRPHFLLFFFAYDFTTQTPAIQVLANYLS